MSQKLFYSWQNDLSGKMNRYGIKAAIEKSLKAIKKSPGLEALELDEATRGVTGAQNIASTILEKIAAADVFVADITAIGK